MEQDKLKEVKEAGEITDTVHSNPLTKKQKVAEQENYWAQFGNGDIFSQTIKKKSKLEIDQENAIKARMKATEQELKTKRGEIIEKVVLKF